jgi:plasmid maintenance system antidote protein VapI
LLIENSIQIQDSPIAALARDVLALRIEKAFGVKRYTLMRMGAADEIAQTRKREKLIRVVRG